jgi:hypothetical protein
MKERISDQRFPNLAAEQFLLWLETKCGAIQAKEALDAVRQAEREATCNRVLGEITKRGLAYHGGLRGASIKGQMLNGTTVEAILRAESGVS